MDRDELLKELAELTVAFHQGAADPESMERCEAILLENDGAIDQYVRLIHVHAALRLLTQDGATDEHSLCCLPEGEGVDGLSVHDAASEWLRHRLADTQPEGRRTVFGRMRRRTRLIAATLLLALTLPFVTHFFSNSTMLPELEPQPVATLVSVDGAVWSGEDRPELDEPLIEGQVLNLGSGRAQISMSCGADLVLKAPCTLTFVAPDEVKLENGLLSVQVAKWTNKFTVATASVDVVDLGRQFVVFADANSGMIEAHAIDGKLQVRAGNAPRDQQRGTLVSTGEALRVDADLNTAKRLKANKKLFDQDFSDTRPFKPLEIYNTGYDAREGDEDPHWRIVDSSEEFNRSFHAVVCNAVKDFYLPNDPRSSQWISISHPVDDNCPPSVMYTFETKFDLTGYDLSTVTIVANILADNGVSNIRVNGKPIKFKPWIDWAEPHNKFRKIEFRDHLIDGVNSIEFDVWNSYVWKTPYGPNPLALRVEWHAFGRLSGDAETLAQRREPPVVPLAISERKLQAALARSSSPASAVN